MNVPDRLLALAALLVLLAGCRASRPEVDPDRLFGHRPEADEDGRQTLLLVPPDSAQAYFQYPVEIFDEVIVRPALFDPALPAEQQQIPVEVLVKGTLPDACTELHALEQERAAHVINVRLLMRRQEGAICASVARPYRFYFQLEGLYGVGAYTLKINGNDHVFPFQIRPPMAASE